jgi:hypothetical protein
MNFHFFCSLQYVCCDMYGPIYPRASRGLQRTPCAVGHLGSEVAGELCVPDGPLTNCVGYQLQKFIVEVKFRGDLEFDIMVGMLVACTSCSK